MEGGGYPGTAVVTRRLLEWWFERNEERKATAKRFFFCQQEAVETVIYLYEAQGRRRMPEAGDLLRYALKLATGTGKTVVMALFVTWATLHKRKVSGSSLSANFLVLVPNLTVRDRVSGQPRGDGLDPAGEHNLYDGFEMVPPEYREEFHPNVLVRNWQGIPLEERPEGSEETVDAFGIPFVGFPVEKRKRPKTGEWGQKSVWIEADPKKAKYRVQVPNVRSWAVGVTASLADLIRVEDLPQIKLNPRETPPNVHVRPVVGGAPEAVMTLEEVRKEWPVLRTAFLMAEELHQETNPGSAAELGIGPTFDELLDVSRRYLDSRVVPLEVGGARSDARDIGIYYWRRQALDALDTAIRGAGAAGVEAVPILGSPEWLDSANLRRFQWTGLVAEGKRCHTNKVPCHTDLEKRFADFLDGAKDVVRYFKNERLGFSVTYYESNRPRQ